MTNQPNDFPRSSYVLIKSEGDGVWKQTWEEFIKKRKESRCECFLLRQMCRLVKKTNSGFADETTKLRKCENNIPWPLRIDCAVGLNKWTLELRRHKWTLMKCHCVQCCAKCIISLAAMPNWEKLSPKPMLQSGGGMGNAVALRLGFSKNREFH